MERKKQTYTEHEAYERLAALCARSELCQADVRQRLHRWELEDEVAERIVARLVQERYVDEARYAQAFVRDKFRYNHWGRVKIELELKRKKIAQHHIEEALSALEGKEQLEALRDIISKKRPTVKGRNEYEIRGKLIRFALGRGFSMQDIVKVVGKLDECMD